MIHNTEQSEPPSLADIVRQETDNGRAIVRFYLDVANGKLDDEGFEACHRVEAAMQVQAIAPELVADAIARLAGVQCHPERRGKRPPRRSRAVGNPSPAPTTQKGALASHPSYRRKACPVLDTGAVSRAVGMGTKRTTRKPPTPSAAATT